AGDAADAGRAARRRVRPRGAQATAGPTVHAVGLGVHLAAVGRHPIAVGEAHVTGQPTRARRAGGGSVRAHRTHVATHATVGGGDAQVGLAAVGAHHVAVAVAGLAVLHAVAGHAGGRAVRARHAHAAARSAVGEAGRDVG